MDFGFSSNENQRYGIRGGLRIYIYCGINLEQQQMENALTRSISRLTIYNVGTFTTSNRIQMKLTRDGM